MQNRKHCCCYRFMSRECLFCFMSVSLRQWYMNAFSSVVKLLVQVQVHIKSGEGDQIGGNYHNITPFPWRHASFSSDFLNQNWVEVGQSPAFPCRDRRLFVRHCKRQE